MATAPIKLAETPTNRPKKVKAVNSDKKPKGKQNLPKYFSKRHQHSKNQSFQLDQSTQKAKKQKKAKSRKFSSPDHLLLNFTNFGSFSSSQKKHSFSNLKRGSMGWIGKIRRPRDIV